jgi:hypothetical protein
MSTASVILKKLQAVDVTLSAQSAIEETASEATKEQRQQLSQGMKSDGTFLPDYSFRSVFQFNKPPGPIRLYDTGDFYRGIFLDVRGDIFNIESYDPKNQMLQDRYGKDIFGLTQESKEQWIQSLRPVFFKFINQYLQ